MPSAVAFFSFFLKVFTVTSGLPTRPSSSAIEDDDSSSIIYRLNSNNGAACILISTDGLIDFDYDTTLGEKRV